MATETIPIPKGATIDDQPAQQAGTVPIPQGATVDSPDQPGEVTNDVGRKVVVPKEGESFADTMKRGAAAGKKLTQQDIDAEMATAPEKTAQTLGAAAAIGVAGPAMLAAPGEAVNAIKAIPGATEAILQHLEEHAADYASKYPSLIALAGKLGIPTTIGGVLLYLAKHSK